MRGSSAKESPTATRSRRRERGPSPCVVFKMDTAPSLVLRFLLPVWLVPDPRAHRHPIRFNATHFQPNRGPARRSLNCGAFFGFEVAADGTEPPPSSSTSVSSRHRHRQPPSPPATMQRRRSSEGSSMALGALILVVLMLGCSAFVVPTAPAAAGTGAAAAASRRSAGAAARASGAAAPSGLWLGAKSSSSSRLYARISEKPGDKAEEGEQGLPFLGNTDGEEVPKLTRQQEEVGGAGAGSASGSGDAGR